jgi:hypothetical protein
MSIFSYRVKVIHAEYSLVKTDDYVTWNTIQGDIKLAAEEIERLCLVQVREIVRQ